MSDNKQHQKPVVSVKDKSKGKEYVKLTPEQKAGKFKTLATKRGEKAIKYIELLGNLSAKNYVYTEDQVKILFSALRDAVNDTEKMFTVKQKVEKVRIQL
jgi:hypothetical protein